MALTKTVQYYLARYELVFSQRGFVDGASYTDVKAQLPALNLLMIISIAAAALFIANIFRKGWVFPIIAVGLVGVHLARRRHDLSGGDPAVRRRSRTSSRAKSRTSSATSRRRATRSASTTIVDDEASTTRRISTRPTSTRTRPTLANIRLWDPAPTQAVYGAQEERLPVLSVLRRRRRPVHGRRRRRCPRPMIACASSTRRASPTARGRTATSCTRTATESVASTANLAVDGEPSYLISEIPLAGELAADLAAGRVLRRGHDAGTPSSTRRWPSSRRRAAKPPRRSGTQVRPASRCRASSARARSRCASATGTCSFPARSRRLAGALQARRHASGSRTAAPFLRFDADPYPVVRRRTHPVGASTPTRSRIGTRTPSRCNPSNLPDGSGLDTDFNYVRNSVKATVDAYDGTITLLRRRRVDDPIIQAYQKAFPELFSRRQRDARRSA